MRTRRPTALRATALRATALLMGIGVALVLSAVAPTAGADAEEETEAARPGQRIPTRGPVAAEPRTVRTVPLDLVGGLLDGTPIVPGDFADPFALEEQDALFVYATNTTRANIPVMEVPKGSVLDADDLGDALPKLPAWTTGGLQWAPAVLARDDGTFVLYYATPGPADRPLADGSRPQCISRALGEDPGGPFVDDSTGPMICPVDQGGAIDPSIYVDGDTTYLLWKSDGDCCRLPTILYAQPLSPDGLSTAGPPHELLTATQGWEGDLIEAPSMVRNGDTYLLFYSANAWDTDAYAIGVAECEHVTGPCHKPLDRPWMSSTGDDQGPGGQEFFSSQGSIWMVHHGWLPGQAGEPGKGRHLYLDGLTFTPGQAVPGRDGAAEAESKLLQLALFGLVGVGGVILLAVFLVRITLKETRRRGHPRDDGDPTGASDPHDDDRARSTASVGTGAPGDG